MNVAPPDGEIRTSTVRALLDKVRKQNYERYLVSLRLERLRLFKGATITFEFPVTALVGPNGGGKTTVLSAAACIYANSEPERIFPRSRIGDDQTQVWHVEYDVIDKSTLPQGTLRGRLQCLDSKWKNTSSIQRDVTLLSLARTLPLAEQPRFDLRAKLTGRGKNNRVTTFETIELPSAATDRIRREAEKILGKSLKEYRFFGVTATTTKMRRVRKKALRVDDQPGDWTPTGRVHTSKQTLFVGKNEISEFSEFNFGAGESSVLRIVAEIESISDGSLLLIDEVENGLHPIAVRRLVEYLIEVGEKRRIQSIFTTHSDYALTPLPPEAIWASIDGRLQQGALTVESLRTSRTITATGFAV